MNKKTTALILVCILVIVGICYAISKKEVVAIETTKVRIAYLPLVHGSPLYLAEEKGYFKEAGLEVELIPFQSPSQIIDALLQGQVDFTSPGGATGIVAIADFKNPNKLKIYSLSGGDDVIQNDSILVKSASTIKTIADLKGKKLGILTGSIQWQTVAKYFLAQNNLIAGKDVVLVDLPINLQTQALASGQVDALIAIEPIPTVIKKNNIGVELVDHFTTKYVSNPFYGGAGILRIEFAEKNPKTTEKVLHVFDRAIEEINADTNVARPYLKKYLSIDDGIIAQVPISRFRMYDKLTDQDINGAQKFMDLFTTYKVIDGKIDFKNLLYSPIVK
ncbi:MAG: ABC transporter substrate-binding protein [Patescibacteria group bacterium]